MADEIELTEAQKRLFLEVLKVIASIPIEDDWPDGTVAAMLMVSHTARNIRVEEIREARRAVGFIGAGDEA